MAQFGYGYDSRGNIDEQTFAHRPLVGNAPAEPTSSYGYDDLDRLTDVTYFDTSADTESFEYDILGNREEVGLRDGSIDIYSVNSNNNRYNSVGGVSLSYDDAGNLTQDENGYMYSWDHDNHLTEVKDSSLNLVAEYVYDALGRRVRKTEYINGGTSTSQVQTDYYYNGWQLLTEVITDAAFDDSIINYAYGNQLDEVLFSVTDDGTAETVNYLTHDHLNSPAAKLDSTGVILERFEYDAYGERHIFNADYSSVLTSSTLTVGFTGQRVDVLDNGDLVLCYYKNRWYLPEMGRFMSEDPLGVEPGGYENEFDVLWQYKDGVNVNQYVNSSPLSQKDSYGFATCCESEIKKNLKDPMIKKLYDRANIAYNGKDEKCLGKIGCQKFTNPMIGGYYNSKTKNIVLNKSLTPEQAKKVLTHELVHAIQCMKSKDCGHCMRKEVQAYSTARQCTDEKSCLDAAWRSCAKACAGKKRSSYNATNSKYPPSSPI